jgi:hypothetical protein
MVTRTQVPRARLDGATSYVSPVSIQSVPSLSSVIGIAAKDVIA